MSKVSKWVCPPWYECKCPLGKLVSKSTMLRHRKEANRIRKEMGRGPFGYGPKVTDLTTEKYVFSVFRSLEEMQTDDEPDGPIIHTGMTQVPNDVLQIPAPLDVSAQTIQGTVAATQPSSPMMVPPRICEESIDGINSSNRNQNGDGDVGELSHPPIERDSNQPDQAQWEIHRNHEMEDSDLYQATGPPLDMPSSGGHAETHDEATEDFLALASGSGSHICTSQNLAWVRRNQGWVELYYRHGLTISAMDDILKLIDAPCKSWKTVRSQILENTGVYSKLQHYETCPGHMCFAARTGENEVTACSICGTETDAETQGEPNPSTSVTYIPLIPRIRSMIEVEGRYNQLYGYLHSRENPDDYMRDYFDSEAYFRLCALFGGPSKVRYDIFIGASTDGFQAFKNNSCDVWPLVATLFNLPPSQRSSVKNMLPLMFIPHDVEPKLLQSYLIPFVNEIENTIANGGFEVLFPDGVRRKVRIHLVWFTTDLAALVKLGGINGVNGKYPCRFCWIKGYYVQQSKHYYFPSWLLDENQEGGKAIFYNPRSIKLRTESEIESVYRRLETAPNTTQRRAIAKETGIKERSVLCDLPTMIPFRCFPPDIMHLIYNVQKELLQHHLSGRSEGYAIPQRDVEFLEQELLAFGTGISSQVAAKPKRLTRFSSWKAADHKAFTLSYALVLFDGYLSKKCMDGIRALALIADICFRPFVTRLEAKEVTKLAVKFIETFENEYVRHQPVNASFCKYVLHLLLHLGDELLYSGPLSCASQYSVEAYIGWIVDRSNARYIPAKSMFASALFGECYKSFYNVDFDKSKNEERAESDIDVFLGPYEDVSVADLQGGGKGFQTLVAKYLQRKYPNIEARSAVLLSRSVKEVREWSRYRFESGSDVQTASIYDRTSRYRPSSYVAVEMDTTNTTADVYYGRLMKLFQFSLKTDPECVMPLNFQEGEYRVAVLQWADGLLLGNQGQVFKSGSRENVFGARSMEDPCIIKRLISVVMHAVPSSSAFRPGTRNVRTYFIDDLTDVDYLLHPSKKSEDGLNRVLKGLRRR